jgi:hypothetical protein
MRFLGLRAASAQTVAFGSPANSIESRDFANPPHDGSATCRAMLFSVFTPGSPNWNTHRPCKGRHQAHPRFVDVVRQPLRRILGLTDCGLWRARGSSRAIAPGPEPLATIRLSQCSLRFPHRDLPAYGALG